ncbi:uncharacterized protein ACR2FA_005687 [Aphomia sociella]
MATLLKSAAHFQGVLHRILVAITVVALGCPLSADSAQVSARAAVSCKVNSTTVHITDEWKPDKGWELACTWNFTKGDTLQSVHLYLDNQLFMIYRPKNHGPTASRIWSLTESFIRVDCIEAIQRCVLTLKPTEYTNKNFDFMCQVSGEGPRFMEGYDNYTLIAIVPSSDPVIVSTKNKQSNQVTLNCTSTGLPAPKFTWTAGPDDGVVPEDFSSSVWNVSSGLWQSWSTFVLQSDASLPIKCMSTVSSSKSATPGKQVEYNSSTSRSPGGILGNFRFDT